ncbi:hypothetical protein GCM10010289_41300 [Streptomyces violascens]|uniref:DUF427 domain-containing protein n=2 Tax=Streptomyces violascens TaxID=67381 RepID=A0ABQ3QZT6_9ACTN|nr:hypothetical protein GCM10010289_41300 [Streptomyces violascens]GHI42767.1 hypothetical protein Sviol_71750 [Streptomyces violascens]
MFIRQRYERAAGKKRRPANAALLMTTGHRITIERGTEHVRVVRDGQVLAESSRPLLLRETGLPVRYYLPPEDVRTDLLTPSDTHTYCPFKGTASYWSLPGAADLVWYYPDPKPDVAEIKDHLCFYEVETVSE